MPGIYRSGYPNARNFPFLATLRLRSILLLFREPYLPDNAAFAAQHHITVHQIPMLQNQEPFVTTNPDQVW